MTYPPPEDGSDPGWTVDVPADLGAALPQEVDPPPEAPRAAPPTRSEESVPPPLPRVIEALLFVGGAPLTAERGVELVRGLTVAHFHELIDELNVAYRRQGRPYRIASVEGGYALVLQARFREVAQRLQGTVREARLTPAALDTLAIVAYREPVTREAVDSARGADSSGPLRQLVRLGLIALDRQAGDPPVVAYHTTNKFLSLFGLQSREDLPRTHDPQQM